MLSPVKAARVWMGRNILTENAVILSPVKAARVWMGRNRNKRSMRYDHTGLLRACVVVCAFSHNEVYMGGFSWYTIKKKSVPVVRNGEKWSAASQEVRAIFRPDVCKTGKKWSAAFPAA